MTSTAAALKSWTQAFANEHDAHQARISVEAARAWDRVVGHQDRMHQLAGDKKHWEGKRQVWDHSIVELRHDLPTDVLKTEQQLVITARDLDLLLQNLQFFYEEYRWPRYFECLNADGHIHSSERGCPSVYATTSMAWNPYLSGRTVAEAIAELGPRLCSVCYPGAPAEHCRTKSDITRAEREAAKAARDAARYVKKLYPAEEFRDYSGSWISTVAGCAQALRDMVQFADYYGHGEHPFYAESVRAAWSAAKVLIERDAEHGGRTQDEIDEIIRRAVKAQRKNGARLDLEGNVIA
jgi:hypothetical protein